MGCIAIGVALVVILLIAERVVVALYFWSQQENWKVGRYYADGWVWGWRGFTKINPNGTTEKSWPFMLLLRFNVPSGGKYVPNAPNGWLSEWSRLSTAYTWEIFQRVGPPEKSAKYDVYLVDIRNTPRLLLGNWAVQNAVWIEEKTPNQTENTRAEEELMKPAYLDHEFEALKIRYEDQVELLRTLTKLDLQIFTGYLTLQVALGGWLVGKPISQCQAQWGIFFVDVALSSIAGMLLYNDYRRRGEVVQTVQNLCEALGFTKEGIYLPSRAINASTEWRPWWYWYLIGIGVATIGVAMIIFRGIP